MKSKYQRKGQHKCRLIEKEINRLVKKAIKRQKEFDAVISRQGMELRVKHYDKRVQEVEREFK